LATPENATSADIRTPVMAEADEPSGWDDPPEQHDDETPSIESPPIAGEMPNGEADTVIDGHSEAAWASAAQEDDALDNDEPPVSIRTSRLGARLKPKFALRLPAMSLTTGCAAMAAMVLGLMIWRVDVVRLLPQTAAFYRLAGLGVNLRGLDFKNVKISTETVDGKPVLVIEGTIVAETRKPVEIPRLRFSVRDAQNTEIYAWNAVLEQAAIKPGETAWFRSRLASPPPGGRSVDVRFFNRLDVTAGGGA
jgi:hypothetical protein